MIGRTFRLLVVLSLAGVIPYAWSSGDDFSEQAWDAVAGILPKWSPNSGAAATFSTPVARSSESSSSAETDDSGSRSRPASHTDWPTLEEVLRFDIDDRWVVGRWPRVSTILSAQNRQGLRVPLVTGTELTDLAGSLTYYFDKHRRVRQISFEGTSGDAGRLLQFAAHRFGVREEPTIKAGLYLARWNGYPTGAVYARHAPIVRENAPHTRMEVRLEINRPDAGYALSHEFLELLNIEWLTRDTMPRPLFQTPIRENVLPKEAPNGGL